MRIHLVRTHYPHWGAHTAFNALTPHLTGAGLQVRDRRVPMDTGRFPISCLEGIVARSSRRRGMREYRLRDLGADLVSLADCLRERVDLIHLLDGEHSLLHLPRWLHRLPRRRRPALVVTLHQPASLLPQLLKPEHLEGVDRILAVSPEQMDLLSRWVPRQRLRLQLLGVDTAHFTPRSTLPPSRPFICLSGGIWMRDYPALLQTAHRLRHRRDLEFHVVSPPADFPEKAENLKIHRHIPDGELLRLYQTSHLLFLPLRNATANTFLMEGAACGLPVLSTDRPSLRAYFPGPEAELVPGNEPAAFAATILRLQAHPAERAKMSRAARGRAVELGWDRVSREYLALYRELTAGHRTRYSSGDENEING